MAVMEVGAGVDAGVGVGQAGYFAVDAAAAAVGRVAAAVDELLSAELATAGTGGLLDLLRSVEVQQRRLHFASVRVVAEIDRRGLAAPAGESSSSGLLRQVLNISRRDSYERVRLAAAICPGAALTGGVMEPVLPVVAAAVADGGLGAVHADIIVSTMGSLPACVAPDIRESVQHFLVEQGRVLDPNTLRRVAREIVLMADPDGPPDERDAHERMEFHVGRRRDSGLIRVWGLLDEVTAEQLRVVFGAMCAPTADRPGVSDVLCK